jgi:hypothetical protein
MKVQIHTFLTSSIDELKWSVSQPGRFTPEENDPGIHGYFHMALGVVWLSGENTRPIKKVSYKAKLRPTFFN